MLNNLLNKLKGKFFRNTSWLVFEQIFRMLLSLVVTGFVARYLGTTNYGLINYGLAFIAIFTTIGQLGLGEIIVHEIIKNRKNTGNIIGTTIGLRLCSAFLSIIIIYVLVLYLNPNETIVHIITFIQSLSLLFVAVDTVHYWFQSNLESKYAVISKSIAFTIVSIWRLLLVYFAASVEFFAFATILETFVIGVFLIVFYFKFKGPRFSFSFKTAKYLLSKSYYFLISGVLVTIYTQMDKILLGHLTDGATVGIFTAAMAVSGMWLFVPYALIDSARPIIMSLKEENEELYTKRFKQLYSVIIWFSIFASLFITAISKFIILIIYGSQYTDSITVLKILIWSKLFALMGVTRTIWLITEDKNKYQIIFLLIGAVTNVVLNLLLIPKYGAIGAAFGTLLAEFISNFVALFFFKDTRPLLRLIIQSILLKGIK